MSTDGIELDTDVIIYMSDLVFNNITFERTGELIEFKHQMSNYVIITESRFTELKNAKITVESSNTNLKTLVQINNSVFDKIEDGFNSFI